MTAPISATNLTRQFDGGEAQPNDPGATIDWAHLVDRLAAGGTFWLTTMDVDGQPHTRPVFAVVVDQAIHVSSSTTAVKTRHLAGHVPTSIALGTEGLDIVWTGTPRRVVDADRLAAVVDAYRAAYGWDVAVDGDARALTAPYGAPTAGPPPYEVFRIEPRTVHAVATDESLAGRSTRWDFDPPGPPARVDRESRTIDAPARQVFDALVDPTALAQWLPPEGMSGRFEHADIRPGGSYRLVLLPDDPVGSGKAGDGTDVVEARIVDIVRDRRIVHAVDFESDDPAFHGTMTMTWTLAPVGGGTRVEVIATNVPAGVSPEDHSAGLSGEPHRLARGTNAATLSTDLGAVGVVRWGWR